jgi:polyphosphate kinase 2
MTCVIERSTRLWKPSGSRRTTMAQYRPQPPPSDLAAAYAQAQEELAVLRNEHANLSRKVNLERSMRPWQVELLKLQKHLEFEKLRMIVLCEGRDAAGKGGTIRRVTRFMNEKHYRVVALGRPSEEQRSQWYFQRYVEAFPAGGDMVLFDRSWYNRAMVERVFGFCTRREYRNFLNGVTGFERDLVRHGTILIKLYFSVTKEEQARRFERRRTDPLRRWKLSEIDLQAQDRWDDFTHRKYEMLVRTDTRAAPWQIVRSNEKHLARLNTMKVILNSVDYKDRDPTLDFSTDPRIVVAGTEEIESMREERRRSGRFIG